MPAYGWFFAAWLLAGVAMAGVFYPPAFAALTGWYGPGRVQALTTLTLAAGFASTIFAPLTAALAGHMDWRGVYLVLAAVLAAVTSPAHALMPRLPWTGRHRNRAAAGVMSMQADRPTLEFIPAAESRVVVEACATPLVGEPISEMWPPGWRRCSRPSPTGSGSG